MSEMVAFQAIVLVCGTTAFVASLRFLRRWLELRQERLLREPPDGLGERLDRIDAVVEATAVEVERISEANRFMAKVLAAGTDPGRATTPKRILTPH